jgi:hypothetical protein
MDRKRMPISDVPRWSPTKMPEGDGFSGEVSCFTTTSWCGVLPGFVEVAQCELPAFVGVFGNLNEAASFTISLRPGSDGFGFKLIRKRDQPSLYFDVTGHKCKLAALLDFIA